MNRSVMNMVCYEHGLFRMVFCEWPVLKGNPTKVWISLNDETLAIKALRAVIRFATSYLCEAGFSVMTVIKTKY